MSKSAIKRIINKDIKEIKNNKLNDLGIYIEFNENNLLEAKAMIIGPKDSVYENGILFLKSFILLIILMHLLMYVTYLGIEFEFT